MERFFGRKTPKIYNFVGLLAMELALYKYINFTAGYFIPFRIIITYISVWFFKLSEKFMEGG